MTKELMQLIDIMAKLRDPVTGCPCDVEQNFSTIAPYTLEEAYEVADAIERNDMPALKEELGDLLLQVAFHAQMADEAGLFDFEDVAEAINVKMIARHPHVFGQQQGIETATDQIENWDFIKAAEKQAKGHHSVLDDIPSNFPALLRAQKLGRKASKLGFDWPEISPVFAKLDEELHELKTAIADQSNIEEELGDALFALVNVARHLDLDAETALRKANRKFESRFRTIEPDIKSDSTLEQMEALWIKAKTA